MSSDITTYMMRERVYVWGVKNHKLPVFSNEKDEVEHYGKPISEFSKRELKDYEKNMEELERYFEVPNSAKFE